jgi:hypothetical protein
MALPVAMQVPFAESAVIALRRPRRPGDGDVARAIRIALDASAAEMIAAA